LSALGTLKATWRWWAPPLVIFGLLAGGIVAWLVSVQDSPIQYAVP
jgi:hypothetical protein